MRERRLEFLAEHDAVRRGLMFEPRGHDMMSGGFLYPPDTPDADAGILFIETSGCLPMCGHGTIGIITFALEHGLINPRTPGKVIAEVPAGVIELDYVQDGSRVRSVRIRNVASWLDKPVIRSLLREAFTPVHPLDPTIRGVSHLLWADVPKGAGADGRNAVFYGDKAIDRSPCGTGTSSRLAHLHAKGRLPVGQAFVHESYIGSRFTGRVEAETEVGGRPAIIPSVEGSAIATGLNEIWIDDEDVFAHGFQVV
jgi:4-hydroxyproline epimerase